MIIPAEFAIQSSSRSPGPGSLAAQCYTLITGYFPNVVCPLFYAQQGLSETLVGWKKLLHMAEESNESESEKLWVVKPKQWVERPAVVGSSCVWHLFHGTGAEKTKHLYTLT